MNLQRLQSGSWADVFFDLGESYSKARSYTSQESSSCTSYSTESSDGFVVDDNYMVTTQSDSFDDMSDIVDSVASVSLSGVSNKRRRRVKSSTESQRKLLASISEESESDPCEAYLRAKMTSLWTRIQEVAQKQDLSETPVTEQDEELLRAYEKKNDSMILLRKKS